MKQPNRIPKTPARREKNVTWCVYRSGPREHAYLGTVNASERNVALARVREQWPEDFDRLHVGTESFERKMLAKLNARVDKNPTAHASHEAGHAAVAWKFGWRIEKVSIRPELFSNCGRFDHRSDSLGRVTLESSFFDLASPNHREEAEEFFLYALAGPTAEYRVRGRSRWQRQGDVETISGLVAVHAPGGEEDEYLLEFKIGAAILVDELWPQIEMVAAALVAQRELRETASNIIPLLVG